MKKHFYLLLVFVLIAVTSQAQEIPPSEVTLFKNVNIFDGENEKLLEGYDVLVVKNLIKKIDKEIEIADTYVIDVKTGGLHPAETAKTHSCDFMTNEHVDVMIYDPVKMVKHKVKVKVIDGKGRTLMPGLIDAHLAHHVKRYARQHDDEYRSGLSQHRSC